MTTDNEFEGKSKIELEGILFGLSCYLNGYTDTTNMIKESIDEIYEKTKDLYEKKIKKCENEINKYDNV